MDQSSGEASKMDQELSELFKDLFKVSSTETPTAATATEPKPEKHTDAMPTDASSSSSDRELADRISEQIADMFRRESIMGKTLLEGIMGSVQDDPSGSQETGAIAAASSSSPDIPQALKQNMESFLEKTQKIKDANSEDEFMEAIRQFQSADESGDNGMPFVPFMQDLMSSLLSKDKLYPALKELSEKFPSWLEKNRTNLDAEMFGRYEAQLRLIREACKEFDEDKDDDPIDVKGQRFERVREIVGEIEEDMRQIPENMRGELSTGWPYNQQTADQFELDPEKVAADCSIM